MGDKWHVLLSPPSLPPPSRHLPREMGGSSQFGTKMKGGTLSQLAACDGANIGDFIVVSTLEDVRGRFESFRF